MARANVWAAAATSVTHALNRSAESIQVRIMRRPPTSSIDR
jgi:hypothetical protein